MEQSQNPPGRKKFLQLAVLAFSALTIPKFFSRSKKISCAPPVETVKMLTEDGRLVEIDKKLLVSSGNKITNGELQDWVKSKPSKL